MIELKNITINGVYIVKCDISPKDSKDFGVLKVDIKTKDSESWGNLESNGLNIINESEPKDIIGENPPTVNNKYVYKEYRDFFLYEYQAIFP